jgi:FkbM family methyltransferase
MKVVKRLNTKLLKLIIKNIQKDNMFLYMLYFYCFILLNIIKIMRVSPQLIKLLFTNRILLFNLCYVAFLQDNGLLRIEKLIEDNTALISFKISSSNLKLKVDINSLSILSSLPYRMLRKIFMRIVKKGHIVVDVGAFIGGYTYLFSELVGNKGKVYAFEPVPYLFNILRFHCSLFNLKNVLTENKAVADNEGYLKLILSEENVQDNRLTYTENVNKYVLLIQHHWISILKNNQFCLIIVKIDVQGADYKVIKGMINLIKKKNLIIFCEFWPEGIRRCRDDPLEFLKFISNLGFKIFETDNKNNRINYINNLKLLLEKYNNNFCDIILVKNDLKES